MHTAQFLLKKFNHYLKIAPRFLPTFILMVCSSLFLAATAPKRVISTTVGTDDLLLAIAKPEQIVALSPLGSDRRYSPHWKEAAKYPSARKGEAEDIIRHRPDLVLLASHSPAGMRAILIKAKIPIFDIGSYATIEDIFSTALRLGKVLGREDHAKACVAKWRAKVAELDKRIAGVKPVRVMAAGLYGFAAGSNTTFQDICNHAGAINVAAEAGLVGHVPIPAEKALSWKVDLLVGPKEDGVNLPARLKELSPFKFMPALKQGKVLQVDAALLAATSHCRIQAFEVVAKALHPERFK